MCFTTNDILNILLIFKGESDFNLENKFCDYLSMLGLKLIYHSKRGHWRCQKICASFFSFVILCTKPEQNNLYIMLNTIKIN